MKVAASALLVGAAAAAVAPQQQVLTSQEEVFHKVEEAVSKSWSKPLHDFEQSLKSLTGEARRIWDEVALMFPESFDKASFFSSPKPHTRRPDHEWDHVVKGADVQSVWVQNENGEQEREIDGKLENYNLRVKKVDPSSLGVDKVKQYSGYLDDDEADKHLFYCEYRDVLDCFERGLCITRVLRVPQ
jgi:cathepsin A (carboxypeptidase C)